MASTLLPLATVYSAAPCSASCMSLLPVLLSLDGGKHSRDGDSLLAFVIHPLSLLRVSSEVTHLRLQEQQQPHSQLHDMSAITRYEHGGTSEDSGALT